MEEVKTWSSIFKNLPWDELVRSIPVLLGVILGGLISPWVTERLTRRRRKSELKHELKKTISRFFNHKKNHLMSSNLVTYYSKYTYLLINELKKEGLTKEQINSLRQVYKDVNRKYKEASVEHKKYNLELIQHESELYGLLSEIHASYSKKKAPKIEFIIEQEIDKINKPVRLFDYNQYDIDSINALSITLKKKLSEENINIHEQQKAIFENINSIL